uniref:Uncharacterized protein n=1 Tax=Alexandrium andersonii TaxID=327968 RepID=A0A7S2GZ99_9DINO
MLLCCVQGPARDAKPVESEDQVFGWDALGGQLKAPVTAFSASRRPEQRGSETVVAEKPHDQLGGAGAAGGAARGPAGGEAAVAGTVAGGGVFAGACKPGPPPPALGPESCNSPAAVWAL